MISFTPFRDDTLRIQHQVYVVGAGGVGARLVPLLVKVLRRGDVIRIIDFDSVSEENLLRQHFGLQDVGRFKAEVLASRYSTSDGPTVEAYIQRVEDFGAETGFPGGGAEDGMGVTIFGAVDNHLARTYLHNLMQFHQPRIYIDMGCSTRTGQAVIVGACYGTIRIDGKLIYYNSTLDHYLSVDRNRGGYEQHLVKFDGILDLVPNILEPDAEESLGCARRIDTQSVISNQYAATVGFNLGLWFLRGMQVNSVGSRFSATSGAVQAFPIQHLRSYAVRDRRLVDLIHTKDRLDSLEEGFKLTSMLG